MTHHKLIQDWIKSECKAKRCQKIAEQNLSLAEDYAQFPDHVRPTKTDP